MGTQQPQTHRSLKACADPRDRDTPSDEITLGRLSNANCGDESHQFLLHEDGYGLYPPTMSSSRPNVQDDHKRDAKAPTTYVTHEVVDRAGALTTAGTRCKGWI